MMTVEEPSKRMWALMIVAVMCCFGFVGAASENIGPKVGGETVTITTAYVHTNIEIIVYVPFVPPVCQVAVPKDCPQ